MREERTGNLTMCDYLIAKRPAAEGHKGYNYRVIVNYQCNSSRREKRDISFCGVRMFGLATKREGKGFNFAVI